MADLSVLVTRAGLLLAVICGSSVATAIPRANGTPSNHPADSTATAGYITIGAGVTAVGGGIVLKLVAQQKYKDIVQRGPREDSKSRKSTVDLYDGASAVLLISGAVAIATGVTLVLIAPARTNEATLAVQPRLGGLAFVGSF